MFELFDPSHPSNNYPLSEAEIGAKQVRGWALKAFFDVQTPLQVRDLTTLEVGEGSSSAPSSSSSTGEEEAIVDNEPSRSPIFVPGCSRGSSLLCPVTDFVAVARRAVRSECVTPPDLRGFAEGTDFDPTTLVIATADGGACGAKKAPPAPDSSTTEKLSSHSHDAAAAAAASAFADALID